MAKRVTTHVYPTTLRRLRPLVSVAILTMATACTGLDSALTSFGAAEGGQSLALAGVSYKAPHQFGGPGGGPVDRLYFTTCIPKPGAKEAGPAATVLLPSLLKSGVNSLASVLKSAGERRVYAAYAIRAHDLPKAQASEAVADGAAETATLIGGVRNDGDADAPGAIASINAGGVLPPCVLFVRGEFGVADEGAPLDAPEGVDPREWAALTRGLEAIWDNEADESDQKVRLIGAPDVLIEAKLRVSRSGQHYRLSPTWIYYGRALGSDTLDAERGLFVEFGVNPAGSIMTDADASYGILPLGNMNVGDFVLFDGELDPRQPAMSWATAPTTSLAGEAANFEMRVVEVRDARPIFTKLGEFIDELETEEDLSTKIRQELFPTLDEEVADLAQRGEDLTKMSEALQAVTDARQALNALLLERERDPANAAVPQQIAIQQALLELQSDAATLYARRAGVSPPQLE